MSEIKAQILGIILVLAIFGAVAGLLVSAFTKSAENISNSLVQEPTISVAGNIEVVNF
jgi:energy-converting hydrogenase Eha subunit A